MVRQVTFKRLISYPNLELAWRRITTGINHQHKRYFRQLYYTYELALNANLRDLHERLRGGSYRAQAPIRVYLPKPSGLQRPLTLLPLEDQIVLQAIANCFALRLASRRHRLELRTVFSNALQKQKGSIFFFYDWHQTYYKFKRKLEALFDDGLRWIAHFDLAAFYDTISHDLLLRTAFPRGQLGEDGRKILEWFKTWSAERQTLTYGHEIPQGPIASDFLAECFLLPIDEALKDLPYVRYVDDIRIFGSSEGEVRKAVIRLEVLCRERGLIPQGKKFAITEAASLEDALGMLPSLAPPNNEEDPERLLIFNATDAVEHFESALAQNTRLITDKTRARYVLYHAEPLPQLLRHVLRLLPKQPEYIDAFVHYLRNFRPSARIGKVCLDVLHATPYEYVQGEMWHLLADNSFFEHTQDLCREAIDIVKSRKRNFATKWGALHFLCRIEHAGFGKYADFVKYQDNARRISLA